MSDQATHVEHTAFRLVSATGDREARAGILNGALSAIVPEDQPAFVGIMLAEILSIVDGLLEGHPDARGLNWIFGAMSEVANMVDEQTP
ncbi:hypothetical protein C3B61_03470 [Cryobacterium zongtaii]|uniref:Uncharacterized protein n=1 Tax=Cryobacterium zongtaii TaxID=1259217 RepID=A0A2S3ZL03_9MICO|nr:hypothetical protein [Cryobacterium zongtaii]POH68972.1 hypothetical protein C3B61_03470 [Cryobacterium zongtaii]